MGATTEVDLALPWRSALGLASAIRRREISPLEVVRHYLSVADARNPELNAIVWRRDDALLAEAKVAERRLLQSEPLPPFFGVPLLIKDLTEVAGEPLTYGSLALSDRVGQADAAVVSLLRRAGFLFMGRSNTPEFGSLPVTEGLLHGPTRNPWDRGRTAGGSSGGAAAAVAAGMAPIAHASDGGGSIRIPAACCGLVGLKPSRGRVPKGPWITDVMHGIATDGCIATTITDAAAFLDVVCARDDYAWAGLPPPAVPFLDEAGRRPDRLRIGWTTTAPFAGSRADAQPCQAAVDALTRAATVLGELGHRVEEVTMTWPMSGEQLSRDFLALWSTSGAYLRDLSDWSKVEPLNRGLRDHGLSLTSHDLVQAVMRLQIFSRQLLQHWGQDFDLLLTPVLATEPPAIGWFHDPVASGGRTDGMYMMERGADMVPYTAWCNVTGQPALALPVHVTAGGLPMGVQLVAPPLREDLLLQVGQELETCFDWARTLPV